MTYVRGYETHSRPRVLRADDRREYVVKALQPNRKDAAILARQIITDQVVGRLANVMGDIAPPVKLIEVGSGLIGLEPELGHFAPGIAHASEVIQSVSPRISYVATYGILPENRSRFARLAMLYGWFAADDHQFFYGNQAPELVYSFDHGHFVGKGDSWTSVDLQNLAPPRPDDRITKDCGLTEAELCEALSAFCHLCPAVIAYAVAMPPDEWGITMDERVDIAECLNSRHRQLVSLLNTRVPKLTA